MRVTLPPRVRGGVIAARDPVERRLERELPRPDPRFAQIVGRQLSVDWARFSRPRGFHLMLLACSVAGLALLLVALAIALS